MTLLVGRRHKGSYYIMEGEIKVTCAQSNMNGRADLALKDQIHDSFALGSLVLKNLPGQTVEQPKARFELLKLRHGSSDVCSYPQLIRHLFYFITSSPIHEHTLITVNARCCG